MAEAKDPSREENVAYWREYLKEAGPSKALAYLLEKNEEERVDVAEHGEMTGGLGTNSLCVSLHLAAQSDAEELLGQYVMAPFEFSILQCHTITIAAAIGEAALRNYFRHLLVNLFGWCHELDGMIDVLTEMFKRHRKMPINSTPEYLESWWETFPPVASQESVPESA